MGARRRVFPEAFKREAVDRVASSGLSTVQVAQELGLHETVLRRWVRDLAPQATGPARRPIPQAAAPSPADLAAENARLRGCLGKGLGGRSRRDSKRLSKPDLELRCRPRPPDGSIAATGCATKRI